MSTNVTPFPTGGDRAAKRRTLPLGAELQPTIARLKEIAAQSGNALLGDGDVHPDHQLLDLCGDALYLLKQSEGIAARRCAMHQVDVRWTDAVRTRYRELSDDERAMCKQAVLLLRRAKKIRASTAAGVYAKALIVRASSTGAAQLAMTLAEDLIACEGLRASLWPAHISGKAQA
jgi:hypothetical protein